MSIFIKEADFIRVDFRQPERAKFENVNLKMVSFLDTDISKINFINVIWPTKKFMWFLTRKIVYDEIIPTRNFALVERIYQQLKKNYEENRDYERAGDFHVGEMEMRRLQKGWFGRNVLSMNIIYKIMSGYGQSWGLAFIWLFVIIFGLPLLYLLTGINGPDGKELFNYKLLRSPLNPQEICLFNVQWTQIWKHYREAVLYGMKTLTLYGDCNYAVKEGGRGVAIIQRITGWFMFAMFSLALKRKFKR